MYFGTALLFCLHLLYYNYFSDDTSQLIIMGTNALLPVIVPLIIPRIEATIDKMYLNSASILLICLKTAMPAFSICFLLLLSLFSKAALIAASYFMLLTKSIANQLISGIEWSSRKIKKIQAAIKILRFKRKSNDTTF